MLIGGHDGTSNYRLRRRIREPADSSSAVVQDGSGSGLETVIPAMEFTAVFEMFAIPALATLW